MSGQSDPLPPALALRWHELTALRYRRSRKELRAPWFIAVDAPGPETFRVIADLFGRETADEGLSVIALDEFAHLHPDFGHHSRNGTPALAAEIAASVVEFSARLALQSLALREHLVLQHAPPLAPYLQLQLLSELLEQGGYTAVLVKAGTGGHGRHAVDLEQAVRRRNVHVLLTEWTGVASAGDDLGPISRPLPVADPEMVTPCHPEDPERQRREAQLARILSMLK